MVGEYARVRPPYKSTKSSQGNKIPRDIFEDAKNLNCISLRLCAFATLRLRDFAVTAKRMFILEGYGEALL
jgi:hypothetical protein